MDEGQRVIAHVLATVGGRVHTTKLVKLVYLVDYVYAQNFGQTATGFKYHWDHYGPNAVGHAVIRETEDLVNRGVVSCYQHISMYGTLAMMFKIADPERLPPLEPAKSAVVRDILAQFGHMGIRDITAASKRTAPFKNAKQYDVLDLDETKNALYTSREDFAAYQGELKKHPPISLEEVHAELGIS